MNNTDVEKLISKKIVLTYLPEYEDVEHKYNFGNVDYINEDEKIFDILKISIRRRGTYWVKKD